MTSTPSKSFSNPGATNINAHYEPKIKANPRTQYEVTKVKTTTLGTKDTHMQDYWEGNNNISFQKQKMLEGNNSLYKCLPYLIISVLLMWYGYVNMEL